MTSAGTHRAGRLRRQCRLAGSAMLGAVLLAPFAAPAAAQESGEAAGTVAREASAESGNAITVTARRREESLQETPIAISAFSAETLEQRQIVQTQDLERITP